MYKQALMCPPDYFKVQYLINPWMGGTVDPVLARSQWDSLKSEIEAAGIKVHSLPAVDGLPDMVFCCNSGISYDDKIFLSHFRHPERQGEENHYKNWYEKHNYTLISDDNDEHFFEGGGDACFSSPDKLWAGYGFRTTKEVYNEIDKIGPFRTILCELINPNFYHFDTCFCPLNEHQALYYPPGFSANTIREMAQNINLIAVSDNEAANFACNSIAVGRD